MTQTTTLIETFRDDLSSFARPTDMPSIGLDLQEFLFEYPAPSDFTGEYVEELYDFYLDPLSSTVRVESTTSSLPKPVVESTPSAVRSAAPKAEDRQKSRREKNRLAAERCRARKSNLISSLQSECDQLRSERDRLRAENKIFLDLLTRAGLI